MKTVESSPDMSSAGILISLLVRFPEIFSINYNLIEARFRLSFMLKGTLEKEHYIKFKRHFIKCVQAYRDVANIDTLLPKIGRRTVNMWTLLNVTWEKETISFEEVDLVRSLVLSEFKNDVIIDLRGNRCLDDDLSAGDKNIIEYMLPPQSRREENLFAFREAGKVYVFDK